jgi:hypothetical protein
VCKGVRSWGSKRDDENGAPESLHAHAERGYERFLKATADAVLPVKQGLLLKDVPGDG